MILKFVFLVLFSVQICTTRAASTNATGNNDLKIICQYHLHTWYEPGSRDYEPDIIDESKCTHIVYTDRVRHTNTSITPLLHDGKKLFYGKIAGFRAKGINVSVRFFKFNLYVFARTLTSDEARAAFVSSLVQFMETYNFNGFDTYWASVSRGDESQYKDEHTNDLMRQLSEAFKPRGWLLSTSVATDKAAIELGFDIKKLSEYVDWMTAMPSFLRANYTTLVSPLYGDAHDELNGNWSVNYLIEKGIPAQKIILPTTAIPTKFQLISAEENGVHAPSADYGWQEFFQEVCINIKQNNWTVVRDDKRIGSYAFQDNQWISYTDLEDIRRYARYVLEMNLGGATFGLNGDDFQDKCRCGKYPFLTALYQALKNIDDSNVSNCT